MQAVPGGSTGLLHRVLQSTGPRGRPGEEFAVDVPLLRELRATEQQAAQELGQWMEKGKQDLDGDAALNALLHKKITVQVLPSQMNTEFDEELEQSGAALLTG
jgi:hypothetical protein